MPPCRGGGLAIYSFTGLNNKVREHNLSAGRQVRDKAPAGPRHQGAPGDRAHAHKMCILQDRGSQGEVAGHHSDQNVQGAGGEGPHLLQCHVQQLCHHKRGSAPWWWLDGVEKGQVVVLVRGKAHV